MRLQVWMLSLKRLFSKTFRLRIQQFFHLLLFDGVLFFIFSQSACVLVFFQNTTKTPIYHIMNNMT